MKQFYKSFGIVAIMLFSFYYTEKIALFMRQKDPIYETIKEEKIAGDTKSVNAVIENETIVPGINGLSINVSKSFQKMKSFGAFNKYYLIFDQIKPEITLDNNKDKIITKGNKNKKSVSIVLSENNELANYCVENKINCSLLITEETFKRDSVLEQINHDQTKTTQTDRLLDSIKKNKNLCIITKYNEEICKKSKKYLIKPSKEINSSNIAAMKGKIEKGDILSFQKNVKLEDFLLIINQIKYQGLNIQNLSDLISEQKN